MSEPELRSDVATEFDLAYTLDDKDVIVAVDGAWDHFALTNAGPAVCAESVLKRPLDDFITGDATRMFTRTMLMSARTLRRPLQRAYRCDSPDTRRYMEMLIEPQADGGVRLAHRLLKTEPIAVRVPIQPATATMARKYGTEVRALPAGYAKRCSLCNRVWIGSAWMELDAAVTSGLVINDKSLRVIYGVCPACFGRPAQALGHLAAR